MQKYILLASIFLFFSECCMVQPKIPANEGSREKAYSMLEKSNILEKLKRKPYLLFSIKDKWYYVISKNKSIFKEYYVVLDSQGDIENIVEKTVKKADNILANSFNSDSYHKGLIDLNSEFYESGYKLSDGNITYFYFKDENENIFGESQLTTLISPIPIDSNVYYFLLNKTLYFNK